MTSGTTAAPQIAERIAHYLRYTRAVAPADASAADVLASVQLAVRETLIDRLTTTLAAWRERRAKTVCYLSMEHLIGPLLRNNLLATGLLEPVREAAAGLGHDLDALLDGEVDPGLGNGGLGRLAACYLDAMATLGYPAYGYGLRYDYGIFRQEIADGWQRERPDTWLDGGYAWEIPRPELTVEAPLGGEVTWESDHGRRRPRWHATHRILGVPHDVIVAGHGTPAVAVLRLWKAEAPDEFDFETFSRGDFLSAVAGRERAEAVTKVLYPSDAVEAGRRLRLLQEYFLAACSVQDVVRRFRAEHGDDWHALPDAAVLQLNDTHPSLAVAELLRILVDEAGLRFADALEITRRTCAYTNHTLRPEALESWPVALMEQLLPRHAQLVYDLNQRLLEDVNRRWPGDLDRLRRTSLVHEDGDKRFRMANLAVAGSHRVNGVSTLHTELLKRHVLPDFVEMWPDKFVSITNGITPRRWLAACNPRLAALITARLGDGWQTDLDRLAALAPAAEDPAFRDAFLAAKRATKVELAALVQRECGIAVDPDSLFDVQIKRMHEYKRQLLLALYAMTLYRRLKADPERRVTPRTFIVGGKAAPAYHMAKLVIRLLNGIAETLARDADVAGRVKLAFVPDYRVSLAERIIPAADLSEQISTAGTEASGTGNMKLSLNGALTVGTLDGANIEIREAVGADNFFVFGATAAEAERLLAPGGHHPRAVVAADAELAAAVDDLRSGAFVGGDASLLRDIPASLLDGGDHFLVLADYRSYVDTQDRIGELYRDRHAWAAMAIRNVAAMGRFSADRAVREYAEMVWGLDLEAARLARAAGDG